MPVRRGAGVAVFFGGGGNDRFRSSDKQRLKGTGDIVGIITEAGGAYKHA